VRNAVRLAVIAAATALAGPVPSAQPTVRWLIVVDDLHFDFRNTGHVRTLVKTVVAVLFRDGDEVAMYSTGPSALSVAWTSDHRIVENAVRNIAGNALSEESGGFPLADGEDVEAALERINERVRR